MTDPSSPTPNPAAVAFYMAMDAIYAKLSGMEPEEQTAQFGLDAGILSTWLIQAVLDNEDLLAIIVGETTDPTVILADLAAICAAMFTAGAHYTIGRVGHYRRSLN